MAIRADNWLHIKADLDSEEGKAIKQEMRDCFYDVKDEWRQMIQDRAIWSFEQMAAGLLILEMTSGKKAVVSDFIKRVMHAYLIGSNDMHLKNISLQKDADDTRHYYDRLTPNYDCLFTDAFENIDKEGYLALDLLEGNFSEEYQHYGYYTGYDFLELGERLDIPEVVVRKIVQEFEKKDPIIKDAIVRSYMPNEMKARAIEIVASRLRALQTGIPRR